MKKLHSPQREIYGKERFTALESMRLAQEIAFGPVVFQVARLMLKYGIFQLLDDHPEGYRLDEIAEKCGLSRYGAQCLLESSLTTGTVLFKDEHFFLAKPGWFLLHDDVARVNLDFIHEVNYKGFFDLDKSIEKGSPEGLKVFGDWPTIYEGLSQLPPEAQKSWLAFDHYYSDCSFDEALEIVFQNHPKSLLDVGGNTGRFATKCVAYNPDVEVTIMDLPQQLQMMQQFTADKEGHERIHGHGANVLDRSVPFPKGFEVIWMSQFLDCFNEAEVMSILQRVAVAMDEKSRLYIMETMWDRQQYETSSYCLTQISLYFTVMANGNSKMFFSEDLVNCIEASGLEVEHIYDGLGKGHSLIVCRKKIVKQ